MALMILAVEAGCRVTAVHVDHGLRAGSSAEAGLVADAAGRFGAAFRSERVAVAPGPNLEARARAARRQVLPPDAATGHTADDQAETILLNLVRGAGLDGLAGIRPGPRHPILALRRVETRQLCAELGVAIVEDPSNDDPSHRRNRIRHQLLPLLDEIAERDVAAVVARQAALLADDADLLDALAASIDPTSVAELAAAPAPLARRALRSWLRQADPEGEAHPPTLTTLERVLAVARHEARSAQIGGGISVHRRAGRLRIERG